MLPSCVEPRGGTRRYPATNRDGSTPDPQEPGAPGVFGSSKCSSCAHGPTRRRKEKNGPLKFITVQTPPQCSWPAPRDHSTRTHGRLRSRPGRGGPSQTKRRDGKSRRSDQVLTHRESGDRGIGRGQTLTGEQRDPRTTRLPDRSEDVLQETTPNRPPKNTNFRMSKPSLRPSTAPRTVLAGQCPRQTVGEVTLR